jgi:hypothetical protein
MSNVDWGIAPTPAELASAQTLGAMELTRLLVRLLHLPRRAWADEDAMGLRSVLEHAHAHEDEWVRLLATVLDQYRATGVVLADTDGLLHVARQVATVVARPQTESQGGSFVQHLRSSELAFTLLRDQPASAGEHFKVSPVALASLETDFRLAEPAASSSGTFAATASTTAGTRTDADSSAAGTSRASADSSEADRPSILLSARAARPVTLGRASGLSTGPGQAKKEKPKVMMVDVEELTKLQAAAEAKKKAEKEAMEAKKKAEKEAAEGKKKAEKEAMETKKKAEKEAAEGKKKAEKEAMETKKKAEKEAAEADAEKEKPKLEPKEPKEPRAKKPKLDAAATASSAFGSVTPDAGVLVGGEEGVGLTAPFGSPLPRPPPLPRPQPHPAQVVQTATSPLVSAFAPPPAPPLADAVLPEAVPEVLRDALRGLGADDLALVVAFFRQDAGRTGAHEIVLSTESKEDGTLSHVMLKLDFGSMSWKRVRRKA